MWRDRERGEWFEVRLSMQDLVARGKDCGHYFKTYEKPLTHFRWGWGGQHRHRTRFVF